MQMIFSIRLFVFPPEILVKGKSYNIKFEEVVKQESLAGKVSPMQLSSAGTDIHIRRDSDHLSGTLENNKITSSDDISIHNNTTEKDIIEESSPQTTKANDRPEVFKVTRDQVSSDGEVSRLGGNQDGVKNSLNAKEDAEISNSEDSTLVSNSLVEGEANSSHNSLCKDLQLLKMKGQVGRPRKNSRGVKNPFDLGCSIRRFGKKK